MNAYPDISPDDSVLDYGLMKACDRFLGWLDHVGYESFDPYDVWGTRYGLWARKVYYSNAIAGVPLVAPLVLMDLICPSLRAAFVMKCRFATADAQLILAYLNMFRITGHDSHVERAVGLAEELLAYSIPGYSGPCWGYPFHWRINKDEVWPANTPYITCTPYAYEAFRGLADTTGDGGYDIIAQSIAEFVYRDLKEIPVGPDSAAGSYSPFDSRRVVNASAYRAYVLADAGQRFQREDYLDAARRNLNFVIESQREDGAWFYAMEGKRSFIDNFHTCFNLKNLFKIQRILGGERLENAIRKGFDFYRNHLIDAAGNPKPFAVKPRTQLVRLEMYDFAEGITLGALLGGRLPEAAVLARSLAKQVIERHQLPSGCFVTRVFRGGFRHRFPFLRWPQAQMFLALTHLMRSIRGNKEGGASREPDATAHHFHKAGRLG